MMKRVRLALTVPGVVCFLLAWLMVGCLALQGSVADEDNPTKKDVPGRDLFGLTKVWKIHIEIPVREWEAMQPRSGLRFPGMPGGPGGFGKPVPNAKPGKPVKEPGEQARHVHRSNFGMEFPWAKGDFTMAGLTCKNVGIRYKGNASYLASARGLKRNFKIEFGHYDQEQRFHGLKKLNLNAGAMDPTKMREAMSFAVFRAAGVPAPRTAYAEVTLTVPGKYDKEYLGLYTVIEQIDKTFVKDRFKNNKGVLMKPEWLRGIDYLGDNWEAYKGRYRPKHEPKKEEAQRVIAFARLINKASDEEFQREIASYLDIDQFLRFIAVNALLSNLDSFLSTGHNYYLYLNPETNKFVFLPWDMDLSFAGFPMMATPAQQMDLSLAHPHAGQNKLIDRLLAMKEVKALYDKILKDLASTCFTKEKLLKNIDGIEQATKEILAHEKKAAEKRKEGRGGFGFGPPGVGLFGRSPDLRTFVNMRTESVLAQLEGKRKGHVLAVGFAPGMPRGAAGNFLARPLLAALDTDNDGKVSKEEFIAGARKFFDQCDKNKTGWIDEKALADGLRGLFPQMLGFGPPNNRAGGRLPNGLPPGPPPDGPPPDGPPPGFPPAGPPPGLPGGPPPPFPGGRFQRGKPTAAMAAALMKRIKLDSNGKASREKFLAAAEALFKECDKNKDGFLDEKEIADGINMLLPPPAGMARPGRLPGGPQQQPGAPQPPPKEGQP